MNVRGRVVLPSRIPVVNGMPRCPACVSCSSRRAGTLEGAKRWTSVCFHTCVCVTKYFCEYVRVDSDVRVFSCV